MPLGATESGGNRLGDAHVHLTLQSLVDDTASIRLSQTRRKTPFPGVDREEIRRPAVWQTPSSWIYVLRVRRLQDRDGDTDLSTDEPGCSSDVLPDRARGPGP
jgi:hypothetical protein